jgi:signal transduction histidine kinase
MRLLLHQLRPSVLEEEGLVKAIQQRLDTVERRANIDSQLIVHGNFNDLPHNIEDELFNITQEALNNSLRHAMAQSVRVNIEENEGVIELSIRDDGLGFDSATKHTGMGLGNMLERARAIAGELSIASEPQHGTCVKVLVNLHKETLEK